MTENNKAFEGYADIFMLADLIWSNKLKIFIINTIFVLVGVLFALSLPNKYTSTALLKTTSEESQSMIANLANQYSGLASMAGISVPSSSPDSSAMAIEILKSKFLFNEIIETPYFRENIFASQDIDPITGKISYDPKLYDPELSAWVRKPKGNIKEKPSNLEVFEVFKKTFNVVKNKETGFIKISYEHISPKFSKAVLDAMVQKTNELTRLKAMDSTSKSIEYLKLQLENNQQNEIISSINAVMESQLKKQMLANVQVDYLITPVDPPFVPEKKSSPSRALICIISLILGIISSFTYVFLLHIKNNYLKK